jgi:hypothetical protein
MINCSNGYGIISNGSIKQISNNIIQLAGKDGIFLQKSTENMVLYKRIEKAIHRVLIHRVFADFDS